MNSKRKGNSGELELLHILEKYEVEAIRNDQMYIGGVDNPDISCKVQGVPIHVECKRVERLNITEAMKQAVRDANGKALPVVAHRKNRQPWLITVPLNDMIKALNLVEVQNVESYSNE